MFTYKSLNLLAPRAEARHIPLRSFGSFSTKFLTMMLLFAGNMLHKAAFVNPFPFLFLQFRYGIDKTSNLHTI